MNLPLAFAARMKRMLGEEYEAFAASYQRPVRPALRLCPAKMPSPLPEELLAFLEERVPWADDGYYYPADPGVRPGKHPYHEAGVYYVQEASAMLPAGLCPPVPGDKVLDLCAAPGGKSTQLATALAGRGVLVANEIHPKRAAVLSQNVERMGIPNAVVTCEAPGDLAERFPCFFDKIVVDAPCSGEGMFKKEEQALAMWSLDNVEACAARQKEILDCAARMLRPDGYLTYSTCTFAPEENEGVIVHFLRTHPEFEVVFSKNPAVLACVEQGLLDRGQPAWTEGGEAFANDLGKTLRIFPHHCHGEGHFAALLHKRADAPQVGAGTFREERKKERGKTKGKEELALEQAWGLFCEFSSRRESWESEPCLFGQQLYLCPKEICAMLSGLRVLRPGLHLGTVVNGRRFEPAHALALAWEEGKRFPVTSEQAQAYLRGEVLACQEEKGWYRITLDGFSLGWGKAGGGMMKNHYPKGLRKIY